MHRRSSPDRRAVLVDTAAGFGTASTTRAHAKAGQIEVEQPWTRATIDRGSTGDTVIDTGSGLDNLVQVGHNFRLGRCCVVVAQVSLAGSKVLRDFVQIGGQAVIAGHIRIGPGARIGAQAGVMSDLPAVAAVVGSPAQARREFFWQVIVLKRMARRGA